MKHQASVKSVWEWVGTLYDARSKRILKKRIKRKVVKGLTGYSQPFSGLTSLTYDYERCHQSLNLPHPHFGFDLDHQTFEYETKLELRKAESERVHCWVLIRFNPFTPVPFTVPCPVQLSLWIWIWLSLSCPVQSKDESRNRNRWKSPPRSLYSTGCLNADATRHAWRHRSPLLI